MANRSLTEIFVRFRNTSRAYLNHDYLGVSRSISPGDDDTLALVQKAGDMEAGVRISGMTSLPPQWIDSVEEIQYDITRIKQRMKDLSALHDKHLNRPTLDDSVDEEQIIEITTQEITQMFHQCQASIHRIGSRSKSASKQEQRLIKNVMSSLASSLQELSTNFKKGQSTYLKRLKNREEREKQYFDTGIPQSSSSFMTEEGSDDELYDRGFTTDQMRLVEDNSAIIEQREREISNIVHSISDLNEIFTDLATMIVDQGTILDQIDYNVEQASVKVEQGLEQLKKGEKHQKSTRKMMCILLLAVIVIILLLALVITKS